MKLRSLILTGVLSIALLGGFTMTSHADGKDTFIKGCRQLVNNKKAKHFKEDIKDVSPAHVLGVYKDSEELKNKKHIDYITYNALEDSYNYAILKAYKVKETNLSKKEYKEVEKHLKAKADNSINRLKGEKSIKVPTISKSLNNKLYKELAVLKVHNLRIGIYSDDKNTRDYISMERNELIDMELQGREAGLLLDAEQVMTHSIQKNKRASKKYDKSMNKTLDAIMN